MKLIAYSIKDTKAGHWNTPFYMNNNGVAIRAIQDMLAQEQINELVRYPEDKELWAIGTYDTSTGTLTGAKQELVANLIDWAKPQK